MQNRGLEGNVAVLQTYDAYLSGPAFHLIKRQRPLSDPDRPCLICSLIREYVVCC